MANIPSPDNYVLGRGKLYSNLYNFESAMYEGERPLGNAPEFTLTPNIEYIDHFSSQEKIRSKDKKAISNIAPSLRLTLDEIHVENLKLLSYATTTDVTQTANATNELVIANPEKGRVFDLGKRGIATYRVAHGDVTGGPFQLEETVTGGTSSATGRVIRVGSNFLLLDTVSGSFADAETITGGTSAATATTTAAGTNVDGSVVVFETATPANVKTPVTDYTIDARTGYLEIPLSSTIANGTSITVRFGNKAVNYRKLHAMNNSKQEGALRFVSNNPEGPQYELHAWRVQLSPDGDTGMIGDDWMTMSFIGDILADDVNHPESRFFDIVSDSL